MHLFYVAVLTSLFTIAVESNTLDVIDIRLVGGSGPYGGRVEIQIDGVWGTVCDEDFHINDATVMCRTMGYLSTGFVAGAHFGQGIGPIFAQKFHCNGYESHIRVCPFEANVFCAHSRDVGVVCSDCGEMSITNGEINSISDDGTLLTISCNDGYQIDKNTSTCRNGSWSEPALICTPIGYPLNISDIRLVNGYGISDGRVEVLVNGTWGTICRHGFGTNDGNAICSILGFSNLYTSRWFDVRYYYGDGSGPIYLNNLQCSGTEAHIDNCTYDTLHTCSRKDEVEIICNYPFNATDIRLVDGTGIYDGRVEIFVNGIWGTVCSNPGSSSVHNSDVLETLCRMLSLNLTMYFPTAVYGQGSGPILTGYLNCGGTKDSINECTSNPPLPRYCNHNNDLSLVCTPCGLPDIPNGYLDSVNGTEFTAKCNDGYIPEEYTLYCLDNGTWIHEDTCTSKYAYPLEILDIRLARGDRLSEGRVEILVDGVWGTVCDNSFTITGATVFCQMVGLQLERFYTYPSRFGQGTGPIYLENLKCNGSELHINNCSYDVENTCTHAEDVSVICTGYQLNITNIRLAGTSGPYHGRIELEVNNTWGTIGHDLFSRQEARVVCRMLGLEFKSKLYSAFYGQGSGPIYVDRLHCGGSETHINQCRYSVDNYYNIQHNKDMSVICWGPTRNITEGRLANGTGDNDGRAEIKIGDTWGTICDENFDIMDADLFCRLLGLRAARFFTGALYGEGSGPVFIDQLFCDQNDADLSSCQYLFLNECRHDQDVSVVCNECGQPDIYYWDVGYFSYKGTTLYADCSYYKTYLGTLQLTCDNNTQTWIKEGECQEYSFPLNITDIRLTDGPTATNGRVEIKSLCSWGTICDDDFGITEANTICTMIGYPPAFAYFPGAFFGEGTGPIFVDDLSCDENATDINKCFYNTYDNCYHSDDISVNCTDCGDLNLKNGLVNSSSTNYGAVVQVTCDPDFKLIGEQTITCQETGTWTDKPKCELIDCGDPTPEHGSSNTSSKRRGSVVYIDCDEGYNISGDAIITCQTNETWTDNPVCEIIDCGDLNPAFADVTLPNNITTYGETALVSCWSGYTLVGNPTISCLSDGDWEAVPTCEIVDCGDPVPNKASANSTETTYNSVVEITCDPGYNITGNATIICQEDGIWSDNPVCDTTDCGVLSVPHGSVNDSQGTILGSVATIECDQGYDLNGASIATCVTSVRGASWNYSAVCMLQVCEDPTADNRRVSDTDKTYDDYEFGNYAEIECNTGYNIVGDSVITCIDGGVWSDSPSCEIVDCGILTKPNDGNMDSSQGTMYNAEITFACSEGYLLVGEEMTVCGEDGEWSNEPPICVAKSAVGGHCTDENYCLMEDSRCEQSVCTCITGIYDNRTKKCDTMPLMPFGAAEGDISLTKNSFCGPKITFEPGFPMFEEMHTDLYVCVNGFVSFDTMYTNPTPPRNRNSIITSVQQPVILAPFYGLIDKRNSGPVWYRTYDILNSNEKIKEDAELIRFIDDIVIKYGNRDSFDASFVLIATWYEAKAIGSGFDKSKTSTFQVVFTSDGKSTYAFYIYGHGLMEWVYNLSDNPRVWIGFRVNTFTYTNAYSFSNAAMLLGSKLTVSSSEQEVAGLIYRPLYSQDKRYENHDVDCIRWYNDNCQNKKSLDYIASLTPECPCDIRLSRFDPLFWQIGLQRWRTDIRYSCVDMLHVGNFGQYGKSCCYDLRTWLWVYERPFAGGFQLYNTRQYPLKHIINDVKPKTSCCVFSDYCNLYYELRPTGSCYRTSPYRFGTFWGDPHFSTLDSMNFTFNGLGEYTLLQVKTRNCSFELQARTERAVKQDGSLSDVTVFAAFAAKDSTNSSVHVERNRGKNGMNVYGKKIDLTNQFNANTDSSNPFVWTSEDNNLTISKRNESVNVFFPSCGISLMVSINIEMLTLTTFVPETLKKFTTGLLGNYDDDPYNDFAFPNGTVLHANLTEREVFEYAKTWAINPNNSAFVYGAEESHKDFHNESYVPRFIDEADPELRAKAVILCNGSQNAECIFDYVFTEKEEIAEETQKIKGLAEADKDEIVESVPTLTGCSTVNAVKGQNVSCKFNASDEVNFVSNNVNAVVDRDSSTIIYFQETDDPVDIRITSTNENDRSSPTFLLEVHLCTGCSGHGLCTNAIRKDARENDHFRYFTCDCEPQYEGIDCENELDGCATNPCSWNRTCEKLTAEEQMVQNRSYKCGPCPAGFTTDDDDECIDIDECASDNGGCKHNCTNSDGSFGCSCYTGYRTSSLNGSRCRDINECDEALHNCDHLCNNTEGGFICECFDGYEFNSTSGSCHPISDDVCNNEQKNKCVDTHGCTLGNGASICFCREGYELDENGILCDDVDECSRGVCPQDCVNTNGSFQCLCYKGYRLEGVATCVECDVLHWGNNCEQTCVCNGRGADRCDPVRGCICEAGWYGDSCNQDEDECASLVQACNDSRKECVNNLGSYSCECKQGFNQNEDGNCDDVDECSDLELNDCEQNCENTFGGYSCTCEDGYTKISNTTCADIDECDLGTDNCEQRCENSDGIFSCFCHYGNSLNDDRRTCSKILDPCFTIKNLNCSHFCLLNNEEAECGCQKGFILETDNETCTDVNECTDSDGNSCDVDATCINIPGSYLCKCPVGKRLENNGRTCSECDNFHFGENCLQRCSCLNGECDKKTGCVCDSGWAGTQCATDIDECSTQEIICGQENTVCVNILGSAYCSCETGYWNNIGNCQDIDECAEDACDQNCINTDGSFTCTCEDGFVLEDKCTDVDECIGIHGCDQICENTVGSYRCVCEDGFRLNLSDRKTCIPEYDCSEEENNNCTGNSSCYVIKGTAYCTCLKGYENINGVCTDINECSTDNPCSHNCENMAGSFMCSCNVGQSISNDAVTCRECGSWKYGNNCDSSCVCIQHNTGKCDSVTGNCTCNTGWTGTICDEDVNECEEGTVCPANSVCENNNGSFACKCHIGYFKTGDGNCDECDYRHFGENCFNKCTCNFQNTEDCLHETGDCICQQGWEGENCTTDVDECTDNNTCGEKQHSTCKNNIGSFVCTCNTGFKEANDTCEDINECLDKTTNKCGQTCENVEGSFACTCETGFRLQDDARSCRDIDECNENTDNCEQNCNNTDGGYFCSCASGFKLEMDEISCKTCDMWTFGLNCQSSCSCVTKNSEMCDNVTGQCICKTGWIGIICDKDINECEDVTVCPENSFCGNLNGSYECTCQVGFNKTDSGQCTDIDECALNINECDQNCTNTNGRYICSCQDGFFLQDDNATCNECEAWTYGENCQSSCSCYVSNSILCNSKTGQCICDAGWNGSRCDVDIDECMNITACPTNSSCLNYNGTYECQCDIGYYKTEAGKCTVCVDGMFGMNCSEQCTCSAENIHFCDHVSGNCSCLNGWIGLNCSDDLDECSAYDYTCADKPYSECNNTIGSFICDCASGYTEQNDTCEDINECDKEDPCTQTCENTGGSFICTCEAGYFLEADNITCRECSAWRFGNNCASNCTCSILHTEACNRTTGECVCEVGWKGQNCDEDIDECSNTTVCPVNSTCNNSEGSYDCICDAGYLMNVTGKCEVCKNGLYGNNCSKECPCKMENTEYCHHVAGNCTCREGWTGNTCSDDINECEDNVTLCIHKANSTCENTNGSYVCGCNTGFREQGDICKDCDIWQYGLSCLLECTCNKTKSKYCDPTTGNCTCESGWNGLNCEDDINECSDKNVCPEYSSCLNAFGSFDCECYKGYFKTGKGKCEVCDSQHFGENCSEECTCDFDNTATCSHVTGNCTCKQGWMDNNCSTDVNECEENSTICAVKDNSFCNNSAGSFVCLCNDGFDEDENNSCSDVDECVKETHGCLQECVNTIGGYICECSPGFEGSWNNCTACMEWKYGKNCGFDCTCDKPHTETCDPEIGECVCKEGWDGTDCDDDINECDNVTICPDHAKCLNSNGSYECRCELGYVEVIQEKCQECDKDHYGENCSELCKCYANTTLSCHHITGNCSCNPGWEADDCSVDVNECKEEDSPCAHKPDSSCVNTNGSFVCVCNDGFQDKDDICTDIEECSESPCSHNCTNIHGSFSCSCPPGYQLQEDAVTCNVCDSDHYGTDCSNICDCVYNNTLSCHGINGECSCKPGWSGKDCSEDVDECIEDTALCMNMSDTICFNTNGSFSCICKNGYRKENNSCIDIDECELGDHSCQQECINSVGGYNCKCQTGYNGTNNDCTECTGNTYGENCTKHCNCSGINSENKDQTCDTVTGECKCKPNWKGKTCTEDINECETDKTLCIGEGNKTCLNTDGWYECDCVRGFTKTFDGNCVEDIDRTAQEPVGEIQIDLTVTLDFSLPTGMNLNASSIYESLKSKIEATLLEFIGRYVAVVIQVIVNDIRFGSLLVDITVVYGTKDAIVASKLTEAVKDLQQGSYVNFDGQNVSASSESYKDLEPCGIYLDITGSCEAGYSCKVENNVPICKLEEDADEVNWTMIIGVSAAGLFLLVATSILLVYVWRIIGRPKKKPHLPVRGACGTEEAISSSENPN